MPASGSLIAATDYNSIQTTIGNILGVGSGNFGYGQTVTSTQVNAGLSLIAANDWANLKIDMLKIANHLGLASNPNITSIPTLTAGTIINAADQTPFATAASYLSTNRFALGAGQYSDESFSPDISQTRSTAWGGASKPTVRHFFTLDFGSVNAARYFFNSGSSLRFTASRSGGTVSTQNTNWSAMLSTMGTVIYSYDGCQSNGTNPGTGSAIGYFSLTSSAQQVFTKTGSGNYSLNDYTITMRTDGTGRYIYVEIYFNDDHTNPYSDTVDGTLTSTVAIRRASGSNVSVTAPTAINTTLLSA